MRLSKVKGRKYVPPTGYRVCEKCRCTYKTKLGCPVCEGRKKRRNLTLHAAGLVDAVEAAREETK